MSRLLLIVLLVCLAGPSRAEAASADGQRARGGGAATPTTVQEVERMWDTYVASQARTALGLNDEAQFRRFGVQLQNLQNLRRRLQRQQNLLQRELNQLVAPGQTLDREAVTAKLGEFDNFGVRSAQQIHRAYSAIDGMLSLRQRVRFRAFETRMAQRKLELLAQARANSRGRGPQARYY